MNYVNFNNIGFFGWYMIGYAVSVLRFSWIALAKRKEPDSLDVNLLRLLLILILCIGYPFYVILFLFKMMLIILGFYDTKDGEEGK